ncbi:uncharacterized protein Pyn_16977 [Prunus yedoensis var. nudiflora]|uniref:Aminotransferase-like plant mobile domain-containing protein n=1 Tax=Prunus yedoensis var. nudiflora TaxID=2094558 RepID=A0A314ZK73_PRUYE|nr:uncharacterized protein Pyn_16977 [Prunus yedoensis var. nudiflora]
MAVETLLNSIFLHVFLWERLKGLDVSPLAHSRARLLVDSDKGSYIPERLLLVCRWSRRMQRKGQNFLELLDGVENFVFHPYCVLLEEFKVVPFYADIDGLVEAPVITSKVSVHYSPHQVRQQFRLDQGVPFSLSHNDTLTLHRAFWSGGNMSEDAKPFTLVLAGKE